MNIFIEINKNNIFIINFYVINEKNIQKMKYFGFKNLNKNDSLMTGHRSG